MHDDDDDDDDDDDEDDEDDDDDDATVANKLMTVLLTPTLPTSEMFHTESQLQVQQGL